MTGAGRCAECGTPAAASFCSSECRRAVVDRVRRAAEEHLDQVPVDVAGEMYDVDVAEVAAVMRLQAAWLTELLDAEQVGRTLRQVLDERLAAAAAATGRPAWRGEHPVEAAGEAAWAVVEAFRRFRGEGPV